MNSVDQVLLVVEGGPDNEKSIPLSGAATVMGRQSANDIVVAETGVSRKHAEIVQTDDGYYLRDLASTNGTFVNDKKISGEDYLLKDGDSIRLGASKVTHIFRSPTSSTQAISLDQLGGGNLGDDEGTQLMPETVGSPATMITDLPVMTDMPPAGGQDREYEGTVQIEVQTEGNMGLVVNFMQQIGEKPEIRVLKMANNREGGVDVSLALRQPIPLQQVLGEVPGVDSINAHEGGEVALTVTLKGDGSSDASAPGAACVFCKEPLESGVTVCPSCGKTQA